MLDVAQRLRNRYGEGRVPRDYRRLTTELPNVGGAPPWLWEIVADQLDGVARLRSSPVLVPSLPVSLAVSVQNLQAEFERDERQLRDQTAALQKEKALVDAEARRLKDLPRGVLPGIFVLATFGVVGIVVPLGMMASRPVSSSLVARRVVFFGFVVGFLALVGYIVWVAVAALADRGDDTTSRMPETVAQPPSPNSTQAGP